MRRAQQRHRASHRRRRGEDGRRAHGNQSEQGGPRRASRNAALGDTLVRVLRFRGTPVEVQNYIDDTGVQVADVIVGFRELEHLDDRRRPADRRHDPLRLLLLGSVLARHRVVRRRQGAAGDPCAAPCTTSNTAATRPPRWARFIVDRIVRAHLPTMARLNIGVRPADLRRRHPAAAVLGPRLRDPQGAGRRVPADGRAARGLLGDADRRWGRSRPAMPTMRRRRRVAREGDRPLERRRDLRRQGHRQPVLEVRSARPRLPVPPVRGAGRAATCSGRRRRATASRVRRRSGRRERIYNVIDSRQMYLQALLSQALRTLGHPEEAENSVHFSYEMVAPLALRRRASSATRRPTMTRRGSRSSRCRAARGSA